MKILLTGASGMVGMNILEHSSVSSYEFLCPPKDHLNLLNRAELFTYLEKHNPDMIIHTAGTVGGIQANINNPIRFFFENSQMGLNILAASKDLGIKRFLNFCSSCVYPKDAENPLIEESILTGDLEPTNEGFALAKLTTLKFCEYISFENQEYLYKTIIPCNLFGRFDSFDLEDSHMIPAAIKKISQAKESKTAKIEIWGDGLIRREYMYAGDLADFVFYAIENFENMPNVINVGTGTDYTINEYYQAISEILDFKCKFTHDLTKPIGMKEKLVSNLKLKEFGWQPTTTLKQGIKKTYDFYSKETKTYD